VTSCEHRDDVGAYVLRALPEEEYRRFAAHLAECEDCARAVASLQVVADTLPLAAPQVEAPPELEDRIMAVVRSEAEVLAASGARADAPPAERRPRRRWWESRSLALRPAFAALAAVVLVAVGVAGGLALSGGGSGTRTVQGDVKIASAPAARAKLLVSDHGTRLQLRDMPPPPAGKVYEVWLLKPGASAPTPTTALFDVTRDGSADVAVPGSRAGMQVLVSAEPAGGSTKPTSAPVVVAKA
jgi:anti-sigma-K factor RskA